jgi:Icc-related predicted phosphoesterase
LALTRLYFATDVHGSEKVWLKFLKARNFYKADVVILGGDLTGKAMVPVIQQSDGTFRMNYMLKDTTVKTKEELEENEKYLRSSGFYLYHTNPKEYDELVANEKRRDEIFTELMMERLGRWLKLADSEFRGSGAKLFVCPGNDDRFEIDSLFENYESTKNVEGKVVWVDDHHEMINTGWSNPTPWQTPREESEEALAQRIASIVSGVKDVPNSIFQLHSPPFGSGLDEAPKLKDFKASASETVPVGSTAVKEAIQKHQPMLGLHGHIHEARGQSKIGRTLCVNPGSSYESGILLGIVINIDKDRIQSYFQVSG